MPIDRAMLGAGAAVGLHIYICVDQYMHICLHMRVCVCVCVCVCMRISMYIYVNSIQTRRCRAQVQQWDYSGYTAHYTHPAQPYAYDVSQYSQAPPAPTEYPYQVPQQALHYAPHQQYAGSGYCYHPAQPAPYSACPASVGAVASTPKVDRPPGVEEDEDEPLFAEPLPSQRAPGAPPLYTAPAVQHSPLPALEPAPPAGAGSAPGGADAAPMVGMKRPPSESEMPGDTGGHGSGVGGSPHGREWQPPAPPAWGRTGSQMAQICAAAAAKRKRLEAEAAEAGAARAHVTAVQAGATAEADIPVDAPAVSDKGGGEGAHTC